MTFKWMTDWDEIWSDPFISQWNEWLEKSENAHVFFHPEFVRVWMDTYVNIRDIKPLFCVAKEGNENIIFLPLVIWKKDWKNAFEKVIIPVGYSDYDYHDPIIVGNMNLDFFWSNLIRQIDLSNLSYNSFLTDDITSQTNSVFNLIKSDECPFIEVENFATIDSYMSYLSKSTRKEIRKNDNNLKKLGIFEYKILNKKDALNNLSALLTHHNHRYPNAYKAPNFHKNLINNLIEKNLLHFSVLSLNNDIISWRIGFIYKKKYYSYMPVFDNKFAKYSVSKLHIVYIIEDLLNKDFKIYDLMRGAKSYKKSFSTNSKRVFSYVYNRNTFCTKLKMVALNVKSKIK